MLSLNKFSFRKLFSLGITTSGVVVLHTRVPLADVDSIQMRNLFEDMIVSINKMNEKLIKELNYG